MEAAVVKFCLSLAVTIGWLSPTMSAQSNLSSVLTSSTLRTATVAIFGDVIVSDDNTVYLLNGDLSNVIRRVRNEGQSPEGMTLTLDENRIMVCWAYSVDSVGRIMTSNNWSRSPKREQLFCHQRIQWCRRGDVLQ